MFIKLFKYDLKFLIKNVIVLYLFSILSAIVYMIVSALADSFSIFQIVEPLFAVLLIIVLIGTILYAGFFLGIKRFYQNVLKDEGYLTNTLPVKKSTIVLSKLLSNVIIMICTCLLCIAILIITDYQSFDLASLGNEVLPGLSGYMFLVILFFVFTAQFAAYATAFYNALSLGHKHNNNKIVYSVVYGIIIYLCMQAASIIVILLYSLLAYSNNTDFLTYLSDENANQVQMDFVIHLLIIATSLNLIFALTNYFIATATLKNKLNLE